MRSLLLGLLLWQAASEVDAPKPEPRRFLYTRAVTLPRGVSGQGCVTLDAPVYAHAAASLKDARLFAGEREVPYALTMSEPVEAESMTARVTNLGTRGGRIVFDLEMPARAYTDVVLGLRAHDFVAGAEVSGTNRPGEVPVRLGTYTLFDLGTRHLSRSTTLHLQEASFRTLHVELTLAAAPGSKLGAAGPEIVERATVPPSREAQTVYTAVAESSAVVQRGRETVASFTVPARVPVERVSFELQPGFAGNFSRTVEVRAKAAGAGEEGVERLAGTIERVRMDEGGRAIRLEQLAVPATLGANLQGDAAVEVAIENGDDPPVPVSSVRLEMRERRLCFPADGAAGLALFYGDASLESPVYDFARLFAPSAGVVPARLGPETRNPLYVVRAAAARSLTERHPEVLWVALLAVVCVLAVVAVHSARRVRL